VTVHNVTERTAEMPLIDVGVPPGFDVISDQLDAAVQQGKISKYTIAARQVIIYVEKLGPNEALTLSYQVKARYPITAATPSSRVYPYYDPTRVSVAEPQQIQVVRG
jgi:uncharacterized protein YfaS (alpha-2-macroglobulin family)